MASSQIRLVIVDDHPLFREGVAHTLQLEPDLVVVGEGGSAAEARELAGRHAPDIVLLDLDMPGGGLSAVRAVAEAAPATRIVILTASVDEDNLLQALRANVHGYIVKGVTSTELARTIRTVHAGQRYVSPELAAHVLRDVAITPPAHAAGVDRLASLTPRERQILELVADGASNREIADRLRLSEGTVKYYVSSIMQKVDARNRVEAALTMRRLRQA